MLNRRILRVKAMQTLYGYYLAKESSLKAAENEFIEKYSADNEIHDFGAKAKIKDRERKIRQFFAASMAKGLTKKESDLEEEIQSEISESIAEVNNQMAKSGSGYKKNMLSEVENLENTYLKMLTLISEFAFLDKQIKDKGTPYILENGAKSKHNLADNPVVASLTDFAGSKQEFNTSGVSWQGDNNLLRKWLKEIVLKDENVMTYQTMGRPSDEDHMSIIKTIFKQIVFKSEIIEKELERRDLYWPENRSVIKSIIVRTLKSYDSESPEKFELKTITPNREEDLKFFVDLFDEVLNRNEELELLIQQKAQNWEMERIAVVDMIILKLALAEMIKFPSIPVKVTINEFIEISKLYSTPKSKQFVNGILDVMANKLSSEGVIKKSGRGLIDNK